LNNSENTGRPR